VTEWISPVDRHRHYGEAARAECAVCLLEAERDRLRAVVDALREYVTTEGVPVTPEVLHAMKGAWARVHEALDQLDVSTDMGGEPRLIDDACLFCQPKTGVTFDPRDQHVACGLRSVVGGIGHLVDHAYWCGERGDPDAGLTYRESALRVVEWIQTHGTEAAGHPGNHAP
jgi:hypothetical protein